MFSLVIASDNLFPASAVAHERTSFATDSIIILDSQLVNPYSIGRSADLLCSFVCSVQVRRDVKMITNQLYFLPELVVLFDLTCYKMRKKENFSAIFSSLTHSHHSSTSVNLIMSC